MAAIPQTESATVAAVKAARVARLEASDRDSRRLSASSWGGECDRALWYAFRWAMAPEKHDGQVRRRFQTGDVEEDRVVADLAHAGFDVRPNDPATGEQWEYSLLDGHGVAKLDGKITGLPEAPKTEHVLEIKSHNDKSFKALIKDGVQKSKPTHYAQMQLGMHGAKLTRALYFSVNKNTDEEYSERVEYDVTLVTNLLARGERIVRAENAPPKLHEDPTAKMAFACGWCAAKELCHQGGQPRRHCRTCLFSTAEMGGDARWTCARHKIDLSVEQQRAGCDRHLYLPTLVPGEQTDAAADGSWVSYRLTDGSTFIDGYLPAGEAVRA